LRLDAIVQTSEAIAQTSKVMCTGDEMYYKQDALNFLRHNLLGSVNCFTRAAQLIQLASTTTAP
jgi:hypothetical protein